MREAAVRRGIYLLEEVEFHPMNSRKPLEYLTWLTRYKRERDTKTYLKRSEVKGWSKATPPPSPPKPHIYRPKTRPYPPGVSETEGAKLGRNVQQRQDASRDEMARRKTQRKRK